MKIYINEKTHYLICCLFLFSCTNQQPQEQSYVIKDSVAEHPAGQTDVLELPADLRPTVHIAFIGLRMPGSGDVSNMTYITGVEIVSFYDIEHKNTQKVNKMLEERGILKA